MSDHLIYVYGEVLLRCICGVAPQRCGFNGPPIFDEELAPCSFDTVLNRDRKSVCSPTVHQFSLVSSRCHCPDPLRNSDAPDARYSSKHSRYQLRNYSSSPDQLGTSSEQIDISVPLRHVNYKCVHLDSRCGTVSDGYRLNICSHICMDIWQIYFKHHKSAATICRPQMKQSKPCCSTQQHGFLWKSSILQRSVTSYIPSCIARGSA